jgi:hypothetical protein
MGITDNRKNDTPSKSIIYERDGSLFFSYCFHSSRSDSRDPKIRHNLAKWIPPLPVPLAIQHATGYKLVSRLFSANRASLLDSFCVSVCRLAARAEPAFLQR